MAIFYGLYSFISVSTESKKTQAGVIVGLIFAVIVVILIAVAVVILYKSYPKEKITNQKVTFIKTDHTLSMPYIIFITVFICIMISD